MGATATIIARVARRVAWASAGEVVGRAVNLALPFLLLAAYPAGKPLDDFFLLMAVAFFFQGSLSNVLIAALVPEVVKQQGKQSIRMFLWWASAGGLLAGCVALSAIGDQHSFWTTIAIAVSVAVMGGSGILSAPAIAALNVDHRYGMPGLLWGLRIIPVGMYLVWRPAVPVLAVLLLGLALADGVRASVLVVGARRHLCIQKQVDALRLPPVAFYIVFAGVIAGVTPLLVRWIAQGESGAISVFEAADRLYSALAALSTLGVGSVTLVYLARLAGTERENFGWAWIFRITIFWGILWLALALLCWYIFPLVLPLLGAQAPSTLEGVQNTLLSLILGLPGFILVGSLSRRLITLGLSERLVPIALCGLLVSVGGALFLFDKFGPVGIGAALSMSQYVVAGLMVFSLKSGEASANTGPR